MASRGMSSVVTVKEAPRPTRAAFVGVLAVLLATGWAANHFAALMPVITASQHLSVASIDAIFGIYAVGLVVSASR